MKLNRWDKKEIDVLKDNYYNRLNKELGKTLGRSIKSISYMAVKLNLKKNNEFYCSSRRHLKFKITKEQVVKYYIKEKKSIRTCAKKLNISKNTFDYYLKKFKIKSRNRSEANKERFKNQEVWCKGLSKETDERLKSTQRKMIKIWKKRNEEKIRLIEYRFKMSFPNTLSYLYHEKQMTQEKIASELKINRTKIIKLMKEFRIKLRPNYQYINSLKGEKHPLYGKTWEEIYGKTGAQKIRKFHRESARIRIIKRIENKEFPFFNTKIEILLANEMKKRGINFISQFNIDNKFVCDFAIPDSKIIIECDGDYWHANPALYPQNKLHKCQIRKIQRDKFKDKYLKNKGWRVIHFYETDLKNTLLNCILQIEKVINNPI